MIKIVTVPDRKLVRWIKIIDTDTGKELKGYRKITITVVPDDVVIANFEMVDRADSHSMAVGDISITAVETIEIPAWKERIKRVVRRLKRWAKGGDW